MDSNHNGPVGSSSASSQPSEKAVIYRKTKRKNKSTFARGCAWIVDHQIGVSLALISLLALVHTTVPDASRHTKKFFELSYYNPQTRKYGKGWDDVFLLCYWIVIFTGLRVAVMDYILMPFAQMSGINTRKERVRFAEQAWLILYAGGFWSLGMYLLTHSDYWLNLRNLWTEWPNRELEGLFKWYYLVQFAFYIQQIIVVNIEEHRKDYHQMFTHHVVTCMLFFGSYGYHFTKVGNLILCLMDLGDIILPLAKTLKYLRFQTACDMAFVVFLVSWFIARHVFYPMVIWSVIRDLPREIVYACYSVQTGQIIGPTSATDSINTLFQPFRDPEGPICFTPQIRWGFLSGLMILEGIIILWFIQIMRLAWKVISGAGSADDPRSDDENEEEEETEEEEDLDEFDVKQSAEFDEGALGPPQEVEVDVTGLNLKGRSSSRRYRKSGAASGVSIPGHSDRKELLGRIGCDKTT